MFDFINLNITRAAATEAEEETKGNTGRKEEQVKPIFEVVGAEVKVRSGFLKAHSSY